MKVYTIAQQKGGSGKTVLAADLTWALAQRGSVLAIDGDPQATLSRRLGWTDDVAVPGTTTDVLSGAMSAADATVASPTVPGVDVLVADSALADLDDDQSVVRRWWEHLSEVGQRWDAVVIDTAPNLKMGTLASLIAADVIVVPAKCAGETLDAMVELGAIVDAAAQARPGQRIDFVVPNEYDPRRGGARRVLEDLTETFGDRVTAPVRSSVAVPDAYDAGKPTSAHARRSLVAQDLQAACAAILTD